ncbi:MAG TPA: molybdenum cofactor biosynthesis protein MoaE [Candidatus Sulfotelmatobacter sp.]|nr:molybdenum cofactor biosynthesis protein MoaE [Candidatus Sulfotelmatobacter sp.]
MNIEIELTRNPIPVHIDPPPAGAHGAWLEFRGVVRDEENGKKISVLEYEAYPEMATREIRRLLEEISSRHPCLAAEIIHRLGIIPVGETAIYVGIASAHRAEGIALLGEFMDKLKQDVPIWKSRAVPTGESSAEKAPIEPTGRAVQSQIGNAFGRPADLEIGDTAKRTASPVTSLDQALARISDHCVPLPAVAMPLDVSFGFGRVLRETVLAPTDLPDCDRSTRDGYAILENDSSASFQIVDAIHAADWKPRQLEPGQTVRVATGASLPCANLRVIMQENVERNGEQIRVLKRETDFNIRRRGEEIKAGAPLVQAGEYLNAGKLALLASAGCVRPVVSPRLHVFHFTTGDEIVPPYQTPKPGQIRDSNSFLIRGLLRHFRCVLFQDHLREDFKLATTQISNRREELERADVVLFSGGASVGDKDFTRPLLVSLGFEIVFSNVPIRPGRPTIFGVNGRQIAFGLPGNPLAHFVCFYLFVAPALALLSGGRTPGFLRGTLAARLDDAANPRETLWPARLELAGGQARLRPLAWSSSGDVTCLTEANALLRVPPNCNEMEPGAGIEFLPANGL